MPCAAMLFILRSIYINMVCPAIFPLFVYAFCGPRPFTPKVKRRQFVRQFVNIQEQKRRIYSENAQNATDIDSMAMDVV